MNTEETIPSNEIEATTPVQPVAPVQIPEVLTPQQALQVLVDVARIAQSKGILALEDAEIVAKAVKVFTSPAGPQATQA
jgi:hypothetical protein